MDSETSIIGKKEGKIKVTGEVLYSENMLWVKEENLGNPGRIGLRVGVTEKLGEQVNPVEFIRILPKGRFIARGHPFGSMEKGRRIVLLRAPVSGIIVEVNEKLREDPTIINKDPYGEGWLIVLEPIDYDEESKYLLPEPPTE